MDFLIPIRNELTGLEKNFVSKQEIANFLATVKNVEHWSGWSHLGELPAAAVAEVEHIAEAVVAEVEHVLAPEAPAPQPDGPVDLIPANPHPEQAAVPDGSPSPDLSAEQLAVIGNTETPSA